MKKRSIIGPAIALVASVAVAGSAMAASPFTNGSFENGNYVRFMPQFDFARVGTGAGNLSPTSIDGWTVTQGNVDWVATYWQASKGTKSVDLDGAEGVSGAISQTFDTVNGNVYAVTFDLSGNPDAGPTVKTGTIDATGTPAQAFSYDITAQGNTHADMKYVPQLYWFTATGTSTTLTFTSTTTTGETAGGYGAVIDNVVVRTGDDCKKGGWQTMHDTSGNGFKNQGDCVSFFATGGKNLGSVAP